MVSLIDRIVSNKLDRLLNFAYSIDFYFSMQQLSSYFNVLVVVTPTVELNALAMKRGEPTVYSFLTGPNSSSSTQSSNSTSSTGGTLQQDQQKLTNGETPTPSVSGASQNGSSKSISQLYNQK